MSSAPAGEAEQRQAQEGRQTVESEHSRRRTPRAGPAFRAALGDPHRPIFARPRGSIPGPRVELVVHAAEPAARDARVDLGRRDVGVPQHHLEGPQVRPVLEQVRGEGVPDHVGREARADPGLAPVARDQLPEALPRHRRPASREKEVGRAPAVERGPTDLEVPHEPARGRLAERHEALLAALARDPENAVVHVHAVAGQTHDLRNAKPRSVEELEHRPIPQAEGTLRVGRLQERLDLVLTQGLRQRQTDAGILQVDRRVLRKFQMRGREGIEAANRRQGARRRARRQAARRKRPEVSRQIRAGRPRGLEPPPGEKLAEGRQVALVGRHAGARESAFDGQVVEIGRQVAVEEAAGGCRPWPRLPRRRQTRPAVSGVRRCTTSRISPSPRTWSLSLAARKIASTSSARGSRPWLSSQHWTFESPLMGPTSITW